MAEYKVLTTNKGFRYMKGAKFCKKSDVPEDILEKLLIDKVVNTLSLCPFCGEKGTEEKTINAQHDTCFAWNTTPVKPRVN
jgi:hypothetical protein